MSYAATEMFLQDCAPNADSGWEWLRHLHERGWTLVTNTYTDLAFRKIGMDRVLVPYPRAGTVRWYYIAGDLGVSKRGELSSFLVKREAFPDPIAAATFAEVQMSDPLVHEDLDIPGGPPKANPQPVMIPSMPMAPAWPGQPPPPIKNQCCIRCHAVYPPWSNQDQCFKCGGRIV